MKQILSQDDFLTELSKRSRFIKKDCKIIFDEMIKMMEESISENRFEPDETKKVIMKIRNFGILSGVLLPKRKGKGGQMLPETSRIIFKLSKNLRYADKHFVNTDDSDLDGFK